MGLWFSRFASPLPAYDLLLYLFISKTSQWDPSVLTEAVNLLSQHNFPKGWVGEIWGEICPIYIFTEQQNVQ